MTLFINFRKLQDYLNDQENYINNADRIIHFIMQIEH